MASEPTAAQTALNHGAVVEHNGPVRFLRTGTDAEGRRVVVVGFSNLFVIWGEAKASDRGNTSSAEDESIDLLSHGSEGSASYDSRNSGGAQESRVLGAGETRWVCLSLYKYEDTASTGHRLDEVMGMGRLLIDCIVAPCTTLNDSESSLVILSFDGVGTVRSHRLRPSWRKSLESPSGRNITKPQPMETVLARQNISVSVSTAKHYYTCSASVPGTDSIIVGTSQGDVCRFDMSALWDRVSKVVKMTRWGTKAGARGRKSKKRKLNNRNCDDSHELEWYVTCVDTICDCHAQDKGNNGTLNMKKKQRTTSKQLMAKRMSRGRYAVATLVKQHSVLRQVSSSSPSLLQSEPESAMRVFNEACCKIRVWDMHSQLALREIHLRPSCTTAPPSDRWWSGLLLPDVKCCVTSCGLCEAAKDPGGNVSKKNCQAGTSSTRMFKNESQILRGTALQGMTIELLRSRGRRQRSQGNHRKNIANNTYVILDVRTVGKLEEGTAAQEKIYQYYIARDGADPRWAFLIDAQEEHLLDKHAQDVVKALPLFESAKSVLVETFRVIETTVNTPDNAGADSNGVFNVSHRPHILITNATTETGMTDPAKSKNCGVLCALDAPSFVSGEPVVHVQTVRGFCKSHLAYVHQPRMSGGRIVVCDADGGVFIHNGITEDKGADRGWKFLSGAKGEGTCSEVCPTLLACWTQGASKWNFADGAKQIDVAMTNASWAGGQVLITSV